MSIFELAEPLFNKVKEIKESLLFSETYNVDIDTFTYGTRDRDYYRFELERLKLGKPVSIENYLTARLTALDEIALAANNMEQLTGDKLSSLYNLILECKTIIRHELENIGQTDHHNPKVIEKNKRVTSFKWHGKPAELDELFKKLSEGFIAKSTTIEDFQTIFSGKESSLIKPICWESSNATELLYFVKKLRDADLIDGRKNRLDYIQIRSCFLRKDGSKFDEAFKSLNTDIEININHASKEIIDNLIEEFK